jgi:outer membrane immunogenic protein
LKGKFMKAFLIAAAAALVAVAAPASAQDFTGARIGVTGGYDNIQDREGVTYGVVVGVDAPVAKGVTLGVEATLEDSTADQSVLEASREIGVAARLGVKVLPKAQIFGKVGYTNARVELQGTNAGVSLEGLRYGGGVEYAVTEKVYTTVEYRRSEYEDGVGGRDGVLVGVGFRF